MKISILCASRERPTRFQDMMQSVLATADKPDDIEILLALDEDDQTRHLYPIPQHVQQVRAPVSHLFNALAHGADGDILAAMGDDVIFRTQGWDTKVREVAARFPDGLYIASPMNGDGLKRVNHWFTGRQWVDLFGWFMPAHFEHFGDDRWVERVAQPCGRLVYMGDVLVEHMHKKLRGPDGKPKAEDDEGYRSKRYKSPDGGSMSQRDEALFIKLAPQLAADVTKLRQTL